VDAKGTVVNSYKYDAFGNIVEAKEQVHNRFKYAGEQYDQVTGQYYLRARFYNPVVGRFTQEDTYRGDGLNLYSYVSNNPVKYVDPSGYCGESKENVYAGVGGGNNLSTKEINFMQSSIKNTTGEYTVLGNADALKAGTLKPSDLPAIKVWKDAQGKIWTLDHRRLAAFKLAGIEEIPVEWASKSLVESQMWKMTTKTGGTSIKLKLGNGESITVK
jgi:RHS repeat-associated protein